MDIKEFLKVLEVTEIDSERVKCIESKYNASMPEMAKKLLSVALDDMFVGDFRILSFDEIKYADEDMYISFEDEGVIPFVDCMDNDFIVYDIKNKAWTMYNVIDKIQFGEMTEFEKLLR